MAMSDCSECWETPCVCGHNYKDWSAQRLADQITVLTRVLQQVVDKNAGRLTWAETIQGLLPPIGTAVLVEARVGGLAQPSAGSPDRWIELRDADGVLRPVSDALRYVIMPPKEPT